jgi:hypothetical protein
MKTVKGKHADLWSCQEMLFAYCQQCFRHVPWRQAADGDAFYGSCCGMAFEAKPLHKNTRFHVSIKKADQTNLVRLADYE